jgi:hypothetical protein
MNVRELLEKSGGRKLVSTLLLFIASSTFLILDIGGADFQQWANFNLILTGIYVGGNIGEKLTNNRTIKPK